MAYLPVAAEPTALGHLLPEALPVEDESQLRGLLAMLRRRMRLIAGFASGAVLLMAIACLFMPRRYTATALVHIRNQPPQVTNIQQVVVPPTYFEGVEFFQDQVKFLESRTLAATVIHDLGLDGDPRFTESEHPGPITRGMEAGFGLVSTLAAWLRPPPPHEPEADAAATAGVADVAAPPVPPWLISVYDRALEVKPVTNSRLIEVKFTSPSPVLAQKVANAHVAAYIRRGLQSKFELTGEARRFLEQEIGRVQGELSKSERELADFRRTNHVVSVDEKENAVAQRLDDLARRVTDAEALRITAEADYRLMQSREYDELPTVIQSPLIQAMKQEISRLEVHQAELAQTFLPASPQMKEVDSQLKQARGRLTKEISRVVGGLESTYLAAKAKEDNLRAEYDHQQDAVLDLKDLSGQYLKLEQAVTANRTLYGTLLTRLGETDVVKGVQLSNASVMDPAERPTGPSEPNIPFNLGFALVLGLALGTGVALVVERTDPSLKTPDEVRRTLRLPTLGVVPDFARLGARRPRRALEALPAVNGGGALTAEAFRSIRTSLLFVSPDRPLRTVLVTSSQPQEGKTSTTVNIGLSLAQLGQRVIVVDADLRQARCHKVLMLPPAPGLAEVLRGRAAVESVIQHIESGRLDLLQAGKPPGDPAELLASGCTDALLRTLAANYDVVLIDSPPVFPITDSAILAPRVDGVVMVVRGHRTDREITREALERLRFMKANVVGVVLNGVDPASSHYRSYSYYFAG